MLFFTFVRVVINYKHSRPKSKAFGQRLVQTADSGPLPDILALEEGLSVPEHEKQPQRPLPDILALEEGLTYIQIGRYEIGKSVPSSDVLQKLAPALDTTSDYLINGSQDEAIAAQLTDRELLKQFKEVELLSPEDKHLVKTFIDAFLTKRHIQELAK